MMLYVKTSQDDLELIEAVADSPRELAKMVGTTANVVSSSINHGHKGWLKLEVEDEGNNVNECGTH